MLTEHHYGDLLGGNVNLKLKSIDNPMVINSFESTSFIERQPENVVDFNSGISNDTLIQNYPNKTIV